ncbi:MAG: sugar phosphate isomerase/epimerase [Clostridia bacterium]|nr:sugar phosphate isomerase/epimerase [Clostridia bacterium]
MKYTDWETAVSASKTDFEFLKEIRSYGITAIELSVALWECGNIDWQGFRTNADKAGIKVLSYHLPFGETVDISLCDEEARKSAVERNRGLMMLAADIGINRFVIHPSYEPIADSERSTRTEQAKSSLIELAEIANGLGAVICVENLPRTCLGHNIAEMKELISSDSRLKVCFDVNHLLAEQGDDHKAFVSELGSKIITAHMSDYDFEDEKHYFCGNGLIDWRELIEALEEADYCGPFLFEGGFTPHRAHPEVPCGTLAEARVRHLSIKSFRGKNNS